MKTTYLLFITFFSLSFAGFSQNITKDELRSFYRVLSVKTNEAIHSENYDLVTILENTYRIVRTLPVNDSVENSKIDNYFKAITLNKNNSDLFPPFIVKLDAEPEPMEASYVVMHMKVDTTNSDSVNVLKPRPSMMNEFSSYLNEFNRRNYIVLNKDYQSLQKIDKQIEAILNKKSLLIAEPNIQNRVKIFRSDKYKKFQTKPVFRNQILRQQEIIQRQNNQ